MEISGLIIAAGKGSRIEQLGSPKSLIKINNKALIDYVITAMLTSGIREIYVVVGYKSDQIINYLKKEYINDNINIQFIINDEWDKGNGISVLCAKHYIEQPFILSMSDHLYSFRIIKKLLLNDFSKADLFLATDLNMSNEFVDIDDVTKVKFNDNNRTIIKIGKHIEEYNGYDTGVFYCNKNFFSALENAIKNGNDSISSAVEFLANNKRALICDIEGEFWVDIDDIKAYELAKDNISRLK